MSVILPQRTQSQVGMTGLAGSEPPPVLYLLHGYSDDDTIWCRRTSIERYAASFGLAVIMPNVHLSYYADMAAGNRYWTFVSEELPAIVQSLFRVSSAREDTFAAGLSMGGYGAFKLALAKPDRFAAAASLSGALDAVGIGYRKGLPAMERIFGPVDSVKGSADDLFHLAEKVACADKPRPKLFQICGTEDFLLDDNRKFKAHAERLGLDLFYSETPGAHEWGYWDRHIQDVLNWLPIRNRSAAG